MVMLAESFSYRPDTNGEGIGLGIFIVDGARKVMAPVCWFMAKWPAALPPLMV